MSSQIQRYVSDEYEVYVDQRSGETFTSISGYARMSERDKMTISRRIKKVASGGLRMVEAPTTQGLRTVTLIGEDQICEWLPKDNPELATKVLKLGVRKYNQFVAGYQPKIEAKVAHPLVEVLPDPFTIREYCAYNKLVLKPGEIQTLGLKVVSHYKAMELESPKLKRCKVKGGMKWCYPHSYIKVVRRMLETI